MDGFRFPPTGWIWTGLEESFENKMFLFRKLLTLDEVPQAAMVKVSADSRYRLYINGKSVSYGPCKGDDQVWYYDEVDIAPFLQAGENVIAAEVLRLSTLRSANHSIWRTKQAGFYLTGELSFAEKREPMLADETWNWIENTSVTFVPEDSPMQYLDIFEKAKGVELLSGWLHSGYDQTGWKPAKPYMMYEMRKSVSPAGLLPRPIPQMFERPAVFAKIEKIRESSIGIKAWNDLLHGEALILEKNSEHIIEIDAGELTTGFIELLCSGGAGTQIEIMQAESYVYESMPSAFMPMPVKGNRSDSDKGHIKGFADYYVVGGFGVNTDPEKYEPFWFRTFRYVRLTIRTFDKPLQLMRFSYRETGYPLDAKTQVETSDSSLSAIWDMSLRTLRRCMHETYEDCPYYEQLQYAMDARTQILYTYNAAADDRMARRCIDDFHRSLRHDGLTNCCWPTVNSNVIPGFSLYYIMMIHDHMMYFGDNKLVERYMPTVDAILSFFKRNIDDRGLVGQVGGVIMANAFWSFIDWTKEWSNTAGVPDAILEGPITMESLLYTYTLAKAAELADYTGKTESAEIYRKRSASVKAAINKYCMSDDGLYQDGPGVMKFSQHCQVWAVLSETAPEEKWKYLMETALERPGLAKCSVATAYYLFRALEKADMYEKTENLWEPWHEMLRNNLTTCVENETDARSDCHAWGSLALSEMPATILGVNPAKPGYAAISVKPVPGYLKWAKGSVLTPRGEVRVSWKKENGVVSTEVHAPEGVEVIYG